MADQYTDFHHYKGATLSRFEKVERRVMELIFTSEIPDDEREESKTFEFMHAGGCMATGRILAERRGLNVDLASVSCILHDVAVIVSGSYKDHAREGGKVAEKILREIGEFSDEEIKTITQAVTHHSEKEVYSEDPYVELVKDADVFECSLYKNCEGFYRIHKPEHIVNEYIKRIKKVRTELGLNPEDTFR